MGSRTRDFAFNVASWGVRKGSNNLFVWSAKTWTKRCLTVSKVKMLGLLWFNVEKKMQTFREIGMLEWICYVWPTHLHWDGLHVEHTPFTKTSRNKFVKGIPAFLKSNMTTLLCRPELRVGTIAIQLENLTPVGVSRSWGGKGQLMAKDKVGVVIVMNSGDKEVIKLFWLLYLIDLWY